MLERTRAPLFVKDIVNTPYYTILESDTHSAFGHITYYTPVCERCITVIRMHSTKVIQAWPQPVLTYINFHIPQMGVIWVAG